MAHPLRREILDHLRAQGPATSTTIAAALGHNSGTTSYHLRVLAAAGVIEEDLTRAHGRERWWRTFPTDHREPDYASLDADTQAALDAWRAEQVPGEIALFERFIREARQQGRWAGLSRGSAYFTINGLNTFMNDYVDLLNRHSYGPRDAPPDARSMQIRMFFLPDEPSPADQ
jgi:DNA-binding transcriptional ArsR family regulator